MIPEALNRRAADLGVTLQQGRHELVDELEPLWLSMFDHHLSTGAAGLIGVMAGNDDAQRFYERRGMTPAIVKLLRVGPKPASEA
jgi:hypothetical protein